MSKCECNLNLATFYFLLGAPPRIGYSKRLCPSTSSEALRAETFVHGCEALQPPVVQKRNEIEDRST
ncbi:hypothetical protein J6590_050462 [Homalodisca vitripennis]|nr:hypothetical protein J6590_050462 [Homalodisca vitripennis]